MSTTDNTLNLVELISTNTISKYIIRYLKFPSPIILEPLDNGLTIGGINTISSCTLNPSIHNTILERAVSLAKKAFEMTSNQ